LTNKKTAMERNITENLNLSSLADESNSFTTMRDAFEGLKFNQSAGRSAKTRLTFVPPNPNEFLSTKNLGRTGPACSAPGSSKRGGEVLERSGRTAL
jgi:hypothetical protein